jgi:uncharacterized tellurite resistance protein B-like protein
VLIWGSRAIKRRLDAGRFHCPSCGADADYELVSAQRHGHVYWIPLFRMGDPVEYVECRRCGGAFDPVVLTRQPLDRGAFVAAFGTAAVAAMSAAAGADGPISDAELSAMRAALERVTGVALSADEVGRMAAVDDPLGTAEGLLAELEPMLSSTGKEAIVTSMLVTAAADGALTPESGAALSRIAGAMQVSPAHLSGIVAGMR